MAQTEIANCLACDKRFERIKTDWHGTIPESDRQDFCSLDCVDHYKNTQTQWVRHGNHTNRKRAER